MAMLNPSSPTQTDSAPKRELPTFTLTSQDLPDIKDWKIGGFYSLRVKVEQIQMGKGIDTYMPTKPGDTTMHARFQIKSVEAMPMAGRMTSQEYGLHKSMAARP